MDLDTIGYVLSNHIQNRQIKLGISYYSNGIFGIPIEEYGYGVGYLGSTLSRYYREISGVAISADFDIEFNQENETIKRNCNISMIINDTSYNNFIKDHKILIIKVSCGINNQLWFTKGVYAISSENISYSSTDKILSLVGQDLTCLLDGTLCGNIPTYSALVEKNSDIVDTIKKLLDEVGIENVSLPSKIQYYYKDELKSTIPEDMNFSTGITVWEIINSLCNLNYGVMRYFDDDGNFVIRGDIFSDNNTMFTYNDGALSTMWERFYDKSSNQIIISQNSNIDKSKLKNCIKVFGKDGVYSGTYIVKDENNPYSVNNIGAIWQIYSGGIYDTITDNSQAESWAKHLFGLTTYQQGIIENTAIDIPDFQVGASIILFLREEQRYIYCRITKIHSDFLGGTMNFSCYEIPKDYQIGGGYADLIPPTYNIETLGMKMTVTVSNYMPSVNYNIYVDDLLLSSFTGNTFEYTFPYTFAGNHNITIKAFMYENSSVMSSPISIDLYSNVILDSNNLPILDNNSEYILDNNI